MIKPSSLSCFVLLYLAAGCVSETAPSQALVTAKAPPLIGPPSAPSEALVAAHHPEALPDTPPAPIQWNRPSGLQPLNGWPVVILMHGWRSNEQDLQEAALWLMGQGFLTASVPAILVEDAQKNQKAWPQDDPARVHRYIQSILEKTPAELKLDTSKVVLCGFSQGGLYALTLLATYPEAYLGAIAISPAGWSTLPSKLAAPKPLVLIGGTTEAPKYRRGFLGSHALWTRHPDAPLQVIEHSGGHHFPPQPQTTLTDSLLWLMSAANP